MSDGWSPVDFAGLDTPTNHTLPGAPGSHSTLRPSPTQWYRAV